MEIDVETFDGGRAARVRPSGRIDVHSVDGLYNAFGELIDQPAVERVIVDFSAIEELDSSAIAAFSVGIDELREAGKQLRAENMNRDQRSALDLMPCNTGGAAGPTEDSGGWFEYVGENAYGTFEELSAFYNVLADTVYSALGLLKGRLPPKGSVTEQAVRVGVDSLPIVGLLSFLLGLILAFQSAHQLRQFGANIYVANLVSISMVREFGPMMTGILIAGRSGSSMAAELGTMKISEEVDALDTMGIDSTRFLILPRMIAISLVQPALTLMSMFVGIFGGFIIARLYLDVSAAIYINKSIGALQMGDLFHGLGKSLVFAWLIGVISCFSGMTVQKGSSGVGRATTRAVVISIFMIIVADSIFTTTATLLN